MLLLGVGYIACVSVMNQRSGEVKMILILTLKVLVASAIVLIGGLITYVAGRRIIQIYKEG